MTSAALTISLVVGIYVLVVLGVGLIAAKRSSESPEEYFLAGRGLGTFVLFMALFGTNATSFVLVGVPGKSFHAGIWMFGLNAPVIALGIPLTFWAIGAPARRMGVRLGAMTPAELYARRFDSRRLGIALFAFFSLYTIPYMVQAIIGASITLSTASGGAIPEPWIGLGVMGIALIYTSLGGMRATAWTNVVQGFLFLAFMITAFLLIARSLGGFEAAMQGVASARPDLLQRPTSPLFTPQGWASWALTISLTVIAFPHMLVRLMSAEGDQAIKSVCRLYPPALLVLWLPAVLFGVWGAVNLPDLERADQVFMALSSAHLPDFLAPVAAVAVLAAVMSTLDAMILTLSSMLVRDVLQPMGWSGATPRAEVQRARIFAVLIAGIVYALAQTWGDSVFNISSKAFSGYVTLVPTLLLGVRWRRFTAAGALGSILVGNGILALGWAGLIPLGGFLPIFWALIGGSVAAGAISLATTPAPAEATARAFGDPLGGLS